VLAALVAAAILTSLPRARPAVSRAALEARIATLPGFAGLVSLAFDGRNYNGQEAARIVTVEVLVDPRATGAILASSMQAAGDIVRRSIDVYQKLAVTGYRSAIDFEEGLAYASRARWLAPELAAPLDGWTVIRLPDEPRDAARALDRIYSKPIVVSCRDGALVATADLETERRARPAAGILEILSAPLADCVDYDNAFLRSPGLRSLDVTILSNGASVAHFSSSRAGYESTDVSRLLAAFAREALTVSNAEMPFAEKYERGILFTPLLFDAIVAADDKAALKELEGRRKAAEDEFYKGLFAKGAFEVSAGPPAEAPR